jgi:beta-xylosidase
MWAAALTAHEGKLYLLVNGNDAGGFVLSTADPEGKWQMQKLDRIYYDPGMIFEDDKVYVACGIGNIDICELDKNFNFRTSTTVLRDKEGLEGCHLYKIGDYYYIYATYGGWPSGQTIFRSKSITGPYEEKVLIEKIINGSPNTVHQGALVETPTGEWWTMLMEDKGAIGRLPSLHPVEWADGWPTLAKNGVPQLVYTKPDVGTTYPEKILPTNDNFRQYPLGMQWEWNHNPDNGKWSLFERPGFLRLYTASVTDDLMQARNTLTQRIFAFHNTKSPYGLDTSRPSTGTVALHLKNMKEGDMAGLTIQQDPYAYIAVHMKDGKKQLIWVQDTLKTVDGFVPASVTETSVDIDTVVYLRAQFDCGTGKTKFFYSTDNKEYVQLGNETTHSFNLSVFVGARFGIFNYATQALGGFVDVDWFTTEEQFDEDTYFDPNFEGYNEEMLTAEGLAVESAEMEVMIGLSKALELTATFKDGHTENVAAKAKYEISDPEALDIQSGMVIGRKNGRVSVKATYTDPMGNVLTVSFTASSTFFPWGEEYINTTLFGDGTYREATRAFFPGVNGQMGWVYENGVDMSGYKYLVLKLDKVQKVNAAVNIYPQNSIWGNCYSQPIGDATTVVIPLQEIEYTSGDAVGEPVNTANIMIVALYAGSNGVIDVSDAYLTNNDDYSPEGVSVNSIHAAPEEADGPIYNLQGMRVDRMTKGVYIRNGKKILVK